jgi:hypothetical protein
MMFPKTHSYLVLCLYVAAGLIVSGAVQRGAGLVAGLAVLVLWAVLGRFFWDAEGRQ